MSRVTELEKALTTLFRKGTEVGYTETEIDEFLENIDYHALLQAVWNKAETVYAYRADGKNALSLDYRSSELFKQRATLLYEDVGDSYIGAVFAARSMELWLLEDMGFAVVAKFSVNAGEGESTMSVSPPMKRGAARMSGIPSWNGASRRRRRSKPVTTVALTSAGCMRFTTVRPAGAARSSVSTSCGSCESITRSCGKSCWSWIAVRWRSSAPARWDSSSRTGA